jgi:hypothetical protein
VHGARDGGSARAHARIPLPAVGLERSTVLACMNKEQRQREHVNQKNRECLDSSVASMVITNQGEHRREGSKKGTDICPSPTYPKRDVIRALVPTQMRRGMRGCAVIAEQVIAEQEAHTQHRPPGPPHS